MPVKTLAVSAVALASGWHIIGQGVATGKLTVAAASGTAIRPTAIELKVHAKPSVRSVANWSIHCRKGRRRKNAAGKTTLTTPFTKAVPLPLVRPDLCLVVASATLPAKTTLTVTILAR